MTTKPQRTIWAAGALCAVLAVGVTAIAAERGVPQPRLKPVPPVIRDVAPPQPVPAAPAPAPKTDQPAPAQAAAEDSVQACLTLLHDLGADATAAEPLETENGCRIADPVVLKSVRSGTSRVAFSGGPMLSCPFAIKLVHWLADVVSPAARHHLGAPVDQVLVGPGYVCRGRNGATTGKLSEHAFGNAVDILGLVLAGGTKVMIIEEPEAKGARKSFLSAMRTSACGYFTTVLGPGADEAHVDHYHVDLGKHGSSDRYRICQ
jgi:hypothetical protein